MFQLVLVCWCDQGWRLLQHTISAHFKMFCDEPVVDFASSAKGNNDTFKKYFHGMLDQGIYLPPSAFESYFLNDAISCVDLDKTIEAVRKVF